MHIIADENIPFVKTAFSTVGSVDVLPGRQITHADLQTADILLVRSVTAVNQTLLQNTPVKFVGTATIGYDHIALDYLQQQRIGFANAPGCNATSAAEYVISALLVMAQRRDFELSQKTVGIIGCGNVGSRVLQKLNALGIKCLIYDPPLQAKQPDVHTFVDLDTVLTADVVTLHVPLEKQGDHPTYHLVNQAFLDKLSDDAILINTARGDVIDEAALFTALEKHPNLSVILDVWPQEPNINLDLLQKVELATPHIAGYSFDGKVLGTQMIYQAVCHYFGFSPTWDKHTFLPEPPLKKLVFTDSATDEMALFKAVMACYDIRQDDAKLRLITQKQKIGEFFDHLRKHYPLRREFSCVTVDVPQEKQQLMSWLRGLGFQV